MYTAARSRSSSLGSVFNNSIARTTSCLMVAFVAP
jgi:hypothetical protein